MKTLDRSGYDLVVDERFDGDTLDERVWLPYHLPHWSSRDAARAHFRLRQPGLDLLIEADQRPWYPDGDGWTRVSTLATGEFAGPVGSAIGQHRFKRSLAVREEQPNVALLTPTYGLIECRASAIAHPANMVALWMIGYEDVAEHSAEICVFEIFGRHVSEQSVHVGVGLHPHGDPNITDDFSRQTLSMDATQPHDYAALWTPDSVEFFVDEQLIKVVDQSPDYPLQVMLSVFEFAHGEDDDASAQVYPKVFPVEWLRVSRKSDASA